MTSSKKRALGKTAYFLTNIIFWIIIIVFAIMTTNNWCEAYAETSSAKIELVKNAQKGQDANSQARQIRFEAFNKKMGMKFVKVGQGTFLMGSPIDEQGRSKDELQRQILITIPFFIQTTEVTQKQWETIMGDNPSAFVKCGESCPVENVSWNDVQEFILKINSLQDIAVYRLPTETEWEYACRAETNDPFPYGDCLSTEQANYNGNYYLIGCSKGLNRMMPVPVSSLKANPWNLYDMNGNIWEWCNDWYGEYSPYEVIDPQGPVIGLYKVCRGGSWKHEERKARSANRNRYAPSFRGNTIGFRLVAQF